MITIRIRTTTDAFIGTDGWRPEVARILESLAVKLQTVQEERFFYDVRDSGGNVVGSIKMTCQPGTQRIEPNQWPIAETEKWCYGHKHANPEK